MADVKKQIFVWFGENDFAIHEQIRAWIDLFSKKYGSLNISSFDALDHGFSNVELARQIKNALQVDSLFGMNKLVILKNFLPLKTANKRFKIGEEVLEQIAGSFEKLSETFFIVFAQNETPAVTSTIFKAIKKQEKNGKAEVKEFEMPKGRELAKWASQRAKKFGAEMRPDAAEYLCAMVGNDLWQIANETAKLASYCLSTGEIGVGRQIEKADVQLLVKTGGNENIFQLLDAISNQDKRRAATLFQQQLSDGAEEMYLFFMIAKQARQMLEAKLIVEKEPHISWDELSRRMKVHPFVAKKTLEQIKKFDVDRLKELYAKLATIDRDLKTKNISFELLFGVLISEL
jgi:DNA polymerase-3 subunit delta